MKNRLPRAFLLVWFGQFVSLLGSGLTEFALGVWIYQRTGSPTQYALGVLCLALPRVLLSPFAGALVDRSDRRLVMQLSDLVAGMVTLVAIGLLWFELLEVWHVYLLIALGASCSAFQRPAYGAYVGTLLAPEQLGRANGLISLAQATSSLIAPLAAGFLMASAGLGIVLLLDVLSFGLAVVTLALVPKNLAYAAEHEPTSSLWQDIGAGWDLVRRRGGLRWLFIFMAAAGFLGITTEVLLTPYLLSFTSSANLGLVMAASGAGLLAGGLAMSLWGAPKRLLYGVLGFELLISLCTIGIGLSRLPWLLAVLVFGYFMAVALSDSCSRTLLMQAVEPAYQGRIFALRDALNLLSLSGGLLITAPLAEFVLEPLLSSAPGSGIGLVFLVAGIANSFLVVLAITWKPLWQIET